MIIDTTRELVSELLPETAPDASKADCGNILIIAGTGGMPGAAVLAAYGALRSGAGLCRVATSKDNFDLLRRVIPEAICMRTEYALAELDRFDAVAIGPGMGNTLMTAEIVGRVLRNYKGKLLIDADALNVTAARERLGKALSEYGGDAVITPHAGEAARLLGLGERPADDEEREKAAEELTARFGTAAVLKGKGTLIKGAGSVIYRNTTGNPGMATAGSGDVLSGMITALMGRGLGSMEAAVCAVYIHGLAGDLAAAELGEDSLMARDIVRGIPGAFRICKKRRETWT